MARARTAKGWVPFRERPRREQQRAVAEEIRQVLREKRLERGYIAAVSIGPYDHNPEDMLLPDQQFPEVFRALYDAVEYVTNSRVARGFGPGTRFVVMEVTGETLPDTDILIAPVVWRSWRDRRDPQGYRRTVKPEDLRYFMDEDLVEMEQQLRTPEWRSVRYPREWIEAELASRRRWLGRDPQRLAPLAEEWIDAYAEAQNRRPNREAHERAMTFARGIWRRMTEGERRQAVEFLEVVGV